MRGLLGDYTDRYMAETIDRDTAAKLSTADLLKLAAPKKQDRIRLVEELERRFMIHCVLADQFDTAH